MKPIMTSDALQQIMYQNGIIPVIHKADVMAVQINIEIADHVQPLVDALNTIATSDPLSEPYDLSSYAQQVLDQLEKD